MKYVNDKELYQREFIGNNKCLIDLLKENDSLNPSMEQLFLFAQTIMPRYYTIASSNLKYPDHVKVGVSLD
jgi:sulfite reductase alpha subunit-like flavoprotein